MSVYKDKRSPFYAYDFQIDGHRFHGSTKATGRREAEQKERDLKREAKERLRQSQGQKDGPLTIDVAAGRFWDIAEIESSLRRDIFTPQFDREFPRMRAWWKQRRVN